MEIAKYFMPGFTMQILPAQKIGVFQPYQGTEDQFQITVARYLDIKGAFWFHPANERKVNVLTTKSGKKLPLEGMKMKAKGVKAGVPDCIIMDQRNGFSGFIIELKVGKNKPSEAQIEFLENARKRNWKVLVSWSLDEVISEIDKYFS